MYFVFVLLFSSLCLAADLTVNYGETAIFAFSPNATLLSITSPPGSVVSTYNTTCDLIASLPVTSASFCFAYYGTTATTLGNPVLATITLSLLQNSLPITYVIDVLNYLSAAGAALGPVPQGTNRPVRFNIINTYDVNTYVFLDNLPSNGEFFIGDYVLNNTDLNQPFILFNKLAPFLYRPFPNPLRNNASVQFYGGNITSTIQSNKANLTIIAQANEGPGIVTFLGNNTCNGLFNTICYANADDYDQFCNITYANADQWPAERIITVQIFIIFPIATTFGIPASIASRFILKRDLNDDFNPNIDYDGSFDFSSYLNLKGPLDLVNAAVQPLTLVGQNDGLGLNTGYPTVMPPMQATLGVGTCVTRRDTVRDTCTLDPAFNEFFYLNILVNEASISNLKIPFSRIVWIILILLGAAATCPAWGIMCSNMEWLTTKCKQCDNVIIPWCQTWPPCVICCCCPTCKYVPALRKRKLETEGAKKEINEKIKRDGIRENCGCCMCCCGYYLRDDEESACGRMCDCCDKAARKLSKRALKKKELKEAEKKDQMEVDSVRQPLLQEEQKVEEEDVAVEGVLLETKTPETKVEEIIRAEPHEVQAESKSEAEEEEEEEEEEEDDEHVSANASSEQAPDI